MPDARTIQRCRWAEPTMFLVDPLWAVAEDYSWSRRRDGEPHTVDDTTGCRDCPRFEPRQDDDRRNSGTRRPF